MAKKKKTEKKIKKKKDDKTDEPKKISYSKMLERVREKVRDDVNTVYGRGTSIQGDSVEQLYVPRISSGSFILDHRLGGGWPRGRIHLVWGDKSVNKTTSMVRAVADAQKRDQITNKYLFEMENPAKAVPMRCAWIDMEGTFDFEWAERIGVDLSRLEYCRPQTTEECAEILLAYVARDTGVKRDEGHSLFVAPYDVVVVDSIAAMTPTDELEGSMDDANMGLAARKNNKMFRKLQSNLNKVHKCYPHATPTVFFINQERHKIGVTFGDPRVKSGGKGQDFYSTCEVFFWGNKISYWDEDKKIYPKHTEFSFKIEKNKVSPPKKHGSYKQALSDSPAGDFKTAQIIDAKDTMDWAKRLEVLEEVEDKSKKYWIMNGERFERKKDIVDKYLNQEENYLLLKRDLLEICYPHKQEDEFTEDEVETEIEATEENAGGEKQEIREV